MKEIGTVEKLKIIPLGGLGEFGMNMMAIGYDEKYILIDCGKMFPSERHLGIEAIIPDFTFIRENKDNILGLFLTHGHEDHIGAVPFLLREFDIPVFTAPLTMAMVSHRLREQSLMNKVTLHVVKRGEEVELDPFIVHMVGISHGIPDSCSIAITTPAGIVFHTGDFKIDQTPLDNQIFDYQTIARYGEEGVLLLLSDSTNVERPGHTFSERDVYEDFLKIFTEAQGKILVASFASHLHRMQQIIDLAEEFGRKVAFCGRSMENNSRMAKEMGYLHMPADMEISHKNVGNYKPEEVVVITSGSQAEPNSALSKIATGQHSYVKLKPGDVVALSARKIPGNEKAIAGIINHLYMRGAEVIHDGTLDIHVSGHSCREELKMMINLTRPKFFMPVHGEYRQLFLHARLADKMGIPEENTLIALSGDVVTVHEHGINITDSVKVGHVLVDNSEAEEMDVEAIHDRRILAQEGVVVPIVTIDLSGRNPQMANYHLLSKALSLGDDLKQLLDESELQVAEIVQSCSREECHDEDLMKAKIGKALRKYMHRKLKIRPMILPVILES